MHVSPQNVSKLVEMLLFQGHATDLMYSLLKQLLDAMHMEVFL
jgi:hypothetical protein